MLEERAFVEVELNMALLRQQFRLYYQAQVDNSRRIISAEVLLRWIHPERGLIPPDQFIPLAEETGVILALGNWALEAACTQMKAWENEASTRDLRLSINVSARQFHQPDCVSQVRKILDSSGVNPEKIMLELTESMAIDDIESAASKIRELKKIGVSFSMDDFGTGHSSLAYLKHLPINELKIDKHFVQNATTDYVDATLVRTIIAIANCMELDVVSEGVETEEQMELLKTSGCNTFQGYLFSKPVPLEEFERLLTRHQNDGRKILPLAEDVIPQ